MQIKVLENQYKKNALLKYQGSLWRQIHLIAQR
jgi:hypothetical protein